MNGLMAIIQVYIEWKCIAFSVFCITLFSLCYIFQFFQTNESPCVTKYRFYSYLFISDCDMRKTKRSRWIGVVRVNIKCCIVTDSRKRHNQRPPQWGSIGTILSTSMPTDLCFIRDNTFVQSLSLIALSLNWNKNLVQALQV